MVICSPYESENSIHSLAHLLLIREEPKMSLTVEISKEILEYVHAWISVRGDILFLDRPRWPFFERVWMSDRGQRYCVWSKDSCSSILRTLYPERGGMYEFDMRATYNSQYDRRANIPAQRCPALILRKDGGHDTCNYPLRPGSRICPALSRVRVDTPSNSCQRRVRCCGRYISSDNANHIPG